jgi:phage repressor protein C with HTH and peptisase S24 domain
MNGVYAVHVVSDSMSPRFDPNDLLYVSSMRAAAIGDYVIVEMLGSDGEPGKGYIKRLVKRSASKIVLHQFNPSKEIEIEAAQVRAIHRVFTNNELFGV